MCQLTQRHCSRGVVCVQPEHYGKIQGAKIFIANKPAVSRCTFVVYLQ